MNRLSCAAILLVCSLFCANALGQASGTVSGTISDSSGAIVPGVSVRATNNATGVVTSVVSNDAGVYNLAGLLAGVYRVSAELPGFRTQTYTDVAVGNAAQVRLNFTLQVAAVAQTVEVTISANNLITSSSSSVGEVLPQRQIQDLPLVSNNVLDLVGVMAGVFMTNDAVFGAEQTNFAGVSARDINVQRDGISINSQRWPNGLDSPTRMNPDLVGEIRLILAPVDAEMGRGNGQVQIQTRSGTNKYSGAAVWNVQNSALDANLWVNNRNQTPDNQGRVQATQPPWRNLHDYSLSFGGPIKKNKTFFYTLWNQQIIVTRQTVNPTVLTDCARLGIFRYYDNFPNGASRATVPTVNVDGSPRSPDGSPLRFLSVFGPLASNPTRNDCADAQISTSTLVPTGATSSWDPNRRQIDRTGFITNTLNTMPHANAFDNPGNLVATTGFFATFAPDGLNTATHQWVRTSHGADNLFGVGQDNNRKQINVKLDHNFSDRHKVNGSYSYEKDTSDDAALPTWPSAFFGLDVRHPQVLAVNFTSTLSSSMVNEARFGMSRTGANVNAAPDRPDIGAEVSKLLPQVSGQALAINLGFQNMAFGYGIIPAVTYSSHDNSPRWNYADTLSWTRGTHSFKFGGEYRISSTKSTNAGSVQTGSNRPVANLGNSTLAQVAGIGRPGLTGTGGLFASGNQQIAENLLTFLAGSLSGVSQTRFTNAANGQWNDFSKDGIFKIRDIHQNEFSSFFKDDWKIARDLTLNLGLRWDYYGVPWEKNGLTTGLVGGGTALFGISGRSFDDWMKPGARAALMELTYVGPNSLNPDQRIYDRDLNNFGPAIGFAWQAPAKMTVRGGYQIQYLGGGRGFVLDTALGNSPSNAAIANYVIPASAPYFDIFSLVNNAVIPITPLYQPLDKIPLTDRSQLLNAFDPNFVAPYVQNLTLSVSRNITSKMTLDLRYIGTLSRKMYSNIDLNAPNFLYNGLKEAFDAARRGGESPLLDQMFQGINVVGNSTVCGGPVAAGQPPPACGPVGGPAVNGIPQTGALHLRAAAATSGALANGNYQTLASTLNTLSIGCFNPGNASLPACTQTDSQGRVLASLSGSLLRQNSPENFIKTNPQTNTAVYETNLGHANYHSGQVQFALRPTAGVSTQVTYTLSRNLGQIPGEGPNGTGALFTDPTNRAADYALLSNHRKHTLVNYGTFALPVGPDKLLFSKSSGIWARLAENWQATWVVNLSSGAPVNVFAQPMLYGTLGSFTGVPDIVGPFNPKDYKFKWAEGAAQGNFFADDKGNPLFSKTLNAAGVVDATNKDPQCLNTNIVAASLAPLCTLVAVKDAQGRIVFQHPLPGNRGTFGQTPFEGLGNWSTDMAVQKRFQIAESKSMTVRLDATNVFNHPTPALGGGFFAATGGVPDLSLQSAGTVPFGTLNTKVGNRRFQLKARLDF
jgi:hypothetical protein